MRIVELDEASRKDILADLLKRDPNNYDRLFRHGPGDCGSRVEA